MQENVAAIIAKRDNLPNVESSTTTQFELLGCVQEAGDLIFVPHRWGHATLNLEMSIGIAEEFVYTPLAGWKATLF